MANFCRFSDGRNGRPKTGVMKNPTTDNFEQAVKNYLKPYENNFNYKTMLHRHLDTSRFSSWLEQVNRYKTIRGSRILSSGCGSGGDLREFSRRSAKEIIGVEVDFTLQGWLNSGWNRPTFPCHLFC